MDKLGILHPVDRNLKFYSDGSFSRLLRRAKKYDGKLYKKGQWTPPFFSNSFVSGYPAVRVNYGDSSKMLMIHRIIGELFLPNPNSHSVINHKNFDKTDNRVENLEWCTTKHNIRHAFENFVNPKCISIASVNIYGEITNIFYSLSEAERKSNISKRYIIKSCEGQTSFTGPYKFIYYTK